ncbi:hypothetical protein KIL84_000550 [Mauremys mutica]|uniref:Uncharacterized protein n=1 Tax=Mauremys mutica TaxID=74926 RepID=A0A9D3WZ16_9SAUR|nr:hypothetical protein KIL84_000550 [Mauremys mutica]
MVPVQTVPAPAHRAEAELEAGPWARRGLGRTPPHPAAARSCLLSCLPEGKAHAGHRAAQSPNAPRHKRSGEGRAERQLPCPPLPPTAQHVGQEEARVLPLGPTQFYTPHPTPPGRIPRQPARLRA